MIENIKRTISGGKSVPVELEPKRNNRFDVYFPNSFKIEPFSIETIDKPKFIQGKLQPIKVIIRDNIGPSESKQIYKLLLKGVLNKQFNMSVNLLDPVGICIESWEYKILRCSEVNFGQNDYMDTSISTIILTLEPISVKLKSC